MTDFDHPFVPFEYDPALCDTCGQYHPGAPGSEGLTKAMWRVLLRYGLVAHDAYYGGPVYRPTGHNLSNYPRTQDTLAHLETCPVRYWPRSKSDYAWTRAPEMGEISELTGTFADGPAYRAAITGSLYCECGRLWGEEWALDGMTLGQLIWHTTHDGQEDPA